MEHYGDITKINGHTAPIVDCIIGGSPCQDLSVAGKRSGLDGERSGLYMEQVRIVKEMRAEDEARGRTGVDIRPRYMVWENVPGAFSSNKGEDFRIVLEEIAKVKDPGITIPRPTDGKWRTSGCVMGDGWSVAWRVLDAQFWGTSDKPLPQRRRRIALVADFGGQSAPEILFVRQSVSGDIEPGEQKRKAASADAQGGSHADDRVGIDFYNTAITGDVSSTLGVNCGKQHGRNGVLGCVGLDAYNQALTGDVAKSLNSAATDTDHIPSVVIDTCILDDQGGSQITVRNDGKSPTLRAETHGNLPCVLEPVAFNGSAVTSPVNLSNPRPGDPCHTLGTDSRNYIVCVDQGGGKSSANFSEGTAPTLTCTHGGEPVIALDRASFNQGKNAQYDFEVSDKGKSSPLVAKGPSAVCYERQKTRYIVRRLTPLECERLQGYPDGWTDIGDWVDSNGKVRKTSDAARYKALGNSIALPPWKWVLKRLCACYERDATMASLFDGIGGFPYLWEQLNGKGTCLWASEIEEFPMAVTKARINNEVAL